MYQVWDSGVDVLVDWWKNSGALPVIITKIVAREINKQIVHIK